MAALCAPGAVGAEPAPKSAADWQAMARADLDAVHALILSAHPGVIDQQNPDFGHWSETGYQQALKLMPQVISYDTAMSAVRFYVSGFLDGHMGYSDNARHDYPVYTDGWAVGMVRGEYIVTATLDNWQSTLPPVGAKLMDCDGRSPETIVREDVAPYVDRRDFPAVRDDLAVLIDTLHLSGVELKRCRFSAADGATLAIDVKYQAVPDQQFWSLTKYHGVSTHKNTWNLSDGVLWIHAANFNLQPGTSDIDELNAMLKAMPALRDVRQIVFDVRGNGGGDSSVGERIFEAATGGLEFDTDGIDKLPHMYAQWRVSDVLESNISYYVGQRAQLYGEHSEKVAWLSEFLAKIKAAKAAGEPWVVQDGGTDITRAEVERRHGKLRHFDGAVALLTDYRCASACLDFADVVRRVPGSVHLGQTTSADTVYLEAGSTLLPSGNRLLMPMKVWRNRARGNNQPLVPDIALNVDMSDDVAVRTATLAALNAAQATVKASVAASPN